MDYFPADEVPPAVNGLPAFTHMPADGEELPAATDLPATADHDGMEVDDMVDATLGEQNYILNITFILKK